MLIFVDVDGTVADLHPEWLARYNRDFDDDLTPEECVDWGIEKFVKPACGKKIHEYLHNPDLYENVLPIDGALQGIERLRELDNDIVFVSACVIGTPDQKYEWLVDNGFLDTTPEMKGFLAVYDKSLLTAAAIIDDKFETIWDWSRYRRGPGLLMSQPWNKRKVASMSRLPTNMYVANDWQDVIDYFDYKGQADGFRNKAI